MRCEGVRGRSESVTVILMLNTEQRGSSSTAEGLFDNNSLCWLFSWLKSFSPPVTWTVYYPRQAFSGTMRVWRRAAQVAREAEEALAWGVCLLPTLKTAWPPLKNTTLGSQSSGMRFVFTVNRICVCVCSGDFYSHSCDAGPHQGEGGKLHHQTCCRGQIHLTQFACVFMLAYIMSHLSASLEIKSPCESLRSYF